MTEHATVSDKLAQVAAAAQAGSLKDYAPAAAAAAAGPKTPMSWGSAMRR